jgi:hypothetical protein
MFYLSPQVQHLWDLYKFRVLLFVVFVVLISFYLETVVFYFLALVYPFYLCFKHKMRPQISKTTKGYWVGLIMIGKPVTGIFPGTILQATDRIGKGIFAGSKILLTEYSMQKAIGFIFNKGISKE